MKTLFILFAGCALMTINAMAQSLQKQKIISDFQDGTTQSWTDASGGVAPVNMADIGNLGTGDYALVLSSNGGLGANARLSIMNNTLEWTGNWTTASIGTLTLRVNNVGTSDVTLRVGIDGAGGTFSSTKGVTIPATSGWVVVSIPVTSRDFTADGGTDIAATLANVTVVHLSGSAAPSFQGDPMVATMEMDDIQLATNNASVPLSYLNAGVKEGQVTLNWITAAADQSSAFSIMHSADGNNWAEIATEKALDNDGNNEMRYRWTHVNPLMGPNYYRIRLVEKNGIVLYSKTIQIDVEQNNPQNFTLYPNPSTIGIIRIAGINSNGFMILNAMGMDVTGQAKVNTYNDAGAELNIRQLAAGVYYVRVNNQVKTFVKN